MLSATLRFILLTLCLLPPLRAEPVTPNDPFRVISLQVVKPADPPICCLKPLPPIEPVEEDEGLLSFEDWKLRQAVKANERNSSSRNGSAATKATGNGQVPESSSHQSVIADTGFGGVDATNSSPIAEGVEQAVPHEEISPHFRVPLTDRFNYASLDCSARVHTTHSFAKSPSSILSSKKDKYMLTPCSQASQYVIVELCEDIRIDTVQLANFEFFSGVFKDFTVKVAKTYTTDPEGWTMAGSYRAKNIRGVQVRSFKLVMLYPQLTPHVVISSSHNAARLLPLHSHRFPFPLLQRVLLPYISIACLWPHASRALQVGHMGS